MKYISAACLAVILALSSGYGLRETSSDAGRNYEAALATRPVPKLKPSAQKDDRAPIHRAGLLRRLSLHNYGRKSEPRPALTARPSPPEFIASKPATIDLSRSFIEDTNLQLKLIGAETYQPIDFNDKLADFAEASPIQPQKRGCAASSKTIKSVGMERQLTEQTSLGVEYVYKEKCHSQNMAVLTSHDLPDDTGVKLRLNMRF